MTTRPVFLCFAALLAAVVVQPVRAQQPCESLTSLKLGQATITSTVVVPQGPFRGIRPGGSAGTTALVLPEHCEVKGVAKPSADSEIKFEVWLPTKTWNGKYEQVGNGGWAGAIPTASIADGVMRGYAAAGTDDGHTGGANAVWAMGHPEKFVDFGYRAVHETSVQAKEIIRAFYGKAASHAYFVGCSDGGREALMEAERFPTDFIGIVAGAPANYWTHLVTGGIWNTRALVETPESYIPPTKLPAIQKAAINACDALDGVKDGLISDPQRCHFNPEVLRCSGADSPDCLTQPQIETLKKIYQGPRNPRTGESIFPGHSPGTEATLSGWAVWITGATPGHSLQFMFGSTFYADIVFDDVKWDFHKLNFDTDVSLGDKKAGPILNSNSPNLSAFRARGGKLIQYHGWGDAAIPPLGSVFYYQRVKDFMERAKAGTRRRPIQDFYRLFMVPGMGHCAGGVGPTNFGNTGLYGLETVDADHDVVTALDRWVQKGVAPDKIIATGYVNRNKERGIAMTRPLCPYPEVAKYKGKGSTDDASNFVCAAEPQGRKR